MFTIDLLKKQGLPMKSRPEGVAIVAGAAIVPLIVMIVMVSSYVSDKVTMAGQKQEMTDNRIKTAALSDALALHQACEDEKGAVNSTLSEVQSCLDRHAQWSPVIVTLVENMPNSMLLTKLEGKQRYVKTKVSEGKDAAGKTKDIDVPVRTLHISVGGTGTAEQSYDDIVRAYTERLRNSELLGPRLENVKVSQKVNTVGDVDIVSYNIECAFKAGM